jgi:group II intron reverse transcriptase/maturase
MREQKARRLKALGLLGEYRVEPETNQGVLVFPNAETDRCGGNTLCDEVFEKDNIERAIYKVKSNKGASGIDGMTVDELKGWWAQNGADEERFIRNLHYRPKPVRKVEIPKPNGGMRALGIPCVKDRMIQQALLQVIQPIVDATFSESSYGFRPERSAHQAIEQAKQYYEEGYTTVVDLDLKNYFDTVNHDILMSLVEKMGIKDVVVLHIIRRSLISGVMEGGITTKQTKGTPQGSPLSPLLSNIYLDVFDKELEKRGHKFVRYADDCNIYVKSPRAGTRVMQSATAFLENKLHLTVNQDKSEVGDPRTLKFLGFSLGGDVGWAYIRIHPASLRRLKDKIRLITKRSRGISLQSMLEELKRALMGWLNYFKIARCENLCRDIDRWIRRRIRQFIWKKWKRVRARFRKLKALGLSSSRAFSYACTRKGSWRIAGSQVLQMTLTNDYLKRQGVFSMLEYYTKNSSSKRTAVYRTVRTVV